MRCKQCNAVIDRIDTYSNEVEKAEKYICFSCGWTWIEKWKKQNNRWVKI